jgi:hypothetical protein
MGCSFLIEPLFKSIANMGINKLNFMNTKLLFNP